MKKILLFLSIFSIFTPLNAQRVIKYITFYPVPYGSHQNLSVTDKAVISGRDQGETKISGKLAVSSSSANIFDGSLSVNVGGPTIVNVSQQLKSGNTSAYSPFGPAYMSGNTAISNMEGVLLSGNISGAVNTQGNVNIGMESTANLTSCSSAEATWQALRVKGSEECKYYLTCGGGSGDTGCSGAPEAPPEKTCEHNYYYSEKYKKCLYNSNPEIYSLIPVHITFSPSGLTASGNDHNFYCTTVKSKTYYKSGSIVRKSAGYVGGYYVDGPNYGSYNQGWSGGTAITSSVKGMMSGFSDFKEMCDYYCPYSASGWYLILDRGNPTSTQPVYLRNKPNGYRYPPNYSNGFSTCNEEYGYADIGNCNC